MRNEEKGIEIQEKQLMINLNEPKLVMNEEN